MNGEIAIFGVYMPTILLIAVAASALTLALMRVADFVGFYRALVDLCLYVMVFGLLSFLAIHSGFHP